MPTDDAAELKRLCEEMLALAEKATPGPMTVRQDGPLRKLVLPTEEFPTFAHHEPGTAEYIAAAYNALPTLARALLSRLEAPTARCSICHLIITSADGIFVPCFGCDGSGVIGWRITVYERGCGFPHDDTEERPCEDCGGTGEVEVRARPISLEDLT